MNSPKLSPPSDDGLVSLQERPTLLVWVAHNMIEPEPVRLFCTKQAAKRACPETQGYCYYQAPLEGEWPQ